MTDKLARVVGHVAYCHGCGAPLASRGAWVRLVEGLVPRPDKRDGLPRFGLPRRHGHGDPREARDRFADASSREIGNPAAFYVNCPRCDRGQVVRWPGGRLPRG